MTIDSQAFEQSDVSAEPASMQAHVSDPAEISDEELKGVAGGPWVWPGSL